MFVSCSVCMLSTPCLPVLLSVDHFLIHCAVGIRFLKSVAFTDKGAGQTHIILPEIISTYAPSLIGFWHHVLQVSCAYTLSSLFLAVLRSGAFVKTSL